MTKHWQLVLKISVVKASEPALIRLVFHSHGLRNSRSLEPTLRITRNIPRVKGLLNNSDLSSSKTFGNVPNLETNILPIEDPTVNGTHALWGVQCKVSIMWRSSLAWLPTFLLVIVRPPPHQSIPAAERPFLSVNARPIPPGTALGSLSQSKADLFLLVFFTLPLHSRLSHATPSSLYHPQYGIYTFRFRDEILKNCTPNAVPTVGSRVERSSMTIHDAQNTSTKGPSLKFRHYRFLVPTSYKTVSPTFSTPNT